MKRWLTILSLTITVASIAALIYLLLPGNGVIPSNKPQIMGTTELQFTEQEKGIVPYPVRMLINNSFLRMDDGRDQGDFLLYDRRKRDIFSVSHDDKTILKISHRRVNYASERHLAISIQEEVEEEDAPTVEGRKPFTHKILVNEQECYGVVSLADYLPAEQEAMREYLETLAGEEAQNISTTPKDMLTDCMLSNLIVNPTLHLQWGFPIGEWDDTGYKRFLVSYRNNVVENEAWFELPAHYHTYAINQ